MKPFLFLPFIFLAQIIFAQNFTEVSGVPFEAIGNAVIDFSDLDNDGDDDVLITDRDGRIAELYFNDGFGHFTHEENGNFPNSSFRSFGFADVDGDTDKDMLITSNNGTSLYLNNGQGNFVFSGSDLYGLRWINHVTFSFSDVDGDGDQDMLITGDDASEKKYTNLYLNDGFGKFIEKEDAPFADVGYGAVAFSDVDGDGDEDVLITGLVVIVGSSEDPYTVSLLYRNIGNGNFTTGSIFEGVSLGSVAFSDIDGDDDQDVLVMGRKADGSTELVAKLYRNDGNGNFGEVQGTGFEGVFQGSIAFADVDGDEDQDLLITGRNDISSSYNGGTSISKLYYNDGLGNFTEAEGDIFEDVRRSAVAFSDVDNDGDQDVLIIGVNNDDEEVSKLYLNNSIISSAASSNIEIDFEFILFPNPAKASTLNLGYESKESNLLSLRVYDVEGRLVLENQKQGRVGAQILSVNISSLPQGTYIMELEDGLNVGSKKFFVE